MAHVSLYRKFRPNTWDNVIGQAHIVRTLINQINSDTISHAYLFTGTRGTGKTTCAKIFARAVNCLHPVNGSPCGTCDTCRALQTNANVDVLEIDAASNNGVDEIRQLRESVQYPPAVGRYKVYIIDEVHMLSPSAFNALLKTLEEPPAHVVFILATTEVHKLPQTILSRCMRFDFRFVPKEELVALLKRIFGELNYPYEEPALEILAEHGQGSVRDTLSLSDMCMSYAPDRLRVEAVNEVLGASDFSTLSRLAGALLEGDTNALLSCTQIIYRRGKGIGVLAKELSQFLRDVLCIKNVPGYTAGLNGEALEKMKGLAEVDNFRIGRALDLICNAENALRYTTQPEILFDATLVRAAALCTEESNEALASRVTRLEQELRALKERGVTLAPPAEAPAAGEPAPEAEAPVPALPFTPTDEEPVFAPEPKREEAPDEEDHEETQQVWNQILFGLREMKKNMLYFALQYQSNVHLRDKVLTLCPQDKASRDMMAKRESQEVLSELLKRTMGEEYRFECDLGTGDRAASPATHETLVSLFGETLNVKNKRK